MPFITTIVVKRFFLRVPDSLSATHVDRQRGFSTSERHANKSIHRFLCKIPWERILWGIKHRYYVGKFSVKLFKIEISIKLEHCHDCLVASSNVEFLITVRKFESRFISLLGSCREINIATSESIFFFRELQFNTRLSMIAQYYFNSFLLTVSVKPIVRQYFEPSKQFRLT